MERDRPGKVNKLEVYPYAYQRTFEFLKAAIAEGAHLKTPLIPVRKRRNLKGIADTSRLTTQELREVLWVRMRNIGGAYYSSWITLEELGEQYGFRRASGRPDRERPRQLRNEFINGLWSNCSEETKRRFPLEEIPRAKPPTFRKSSREYERKRDEVLELARSEKSRLEIGQLTGISQDYLRGMLERERQAGNLDFYRWRTSVMDNRYLEQKLQQMPPDPAEREKLLGMVKKSFYIANREMFVSLRNLGKLAGWKGSGRHGAKAVLEILKKAGVPTRRFGRPKGRDVPSGTFNVVLKYDQKWAVDTLRNCDHPDNWGRLIAQLENPPDDPFLRQQLLDWIPFVFFRNHPELFVTLSEFLRSFNTKVNLRRIGKVTDKLRGWGIPASSLVRPAGSQVRRVHLMLRSDFERLRAEAKGDNDWEICAKIASYGQ